MTKLLEGNILSTLRGESKNLGWNVEGVDTRSTNSVASLQLGENFTYRNTRV
jgi:hypothetical protein